MSTRTVGAVLAGGAGLLWLAHRATRATSPASSRSTAPSNAPAEAPPSSAPAEAPAEGWIWPVPITAGRRPVVSDGWGPRRGGVFHPGADLMFARTHPRDQLEAAPADNIAGTPHYFMPLQVPALAASAGRLWAAYASPLGWSVIIDHGRWATFYQHLARLLVAPREGGADGPAIDAGHPVGIIGGSPIGYRLRHLHFELWLGRQPINPEPFLARWQLVTATLSPAGDVALDLRGPARTTRA